MPDSQITMSYDLQYTHLDEIPKIVQSVRNAYNTDITKSLNWRKTQLRQLFKMVDENENLLTRAAYCDMKKSAAETMMSDVMIMKNEIVHSLEQLDDWVKPKKVSAGLIHAMDRCEVRREPFGVALIIGAWNYPYQLTLGPLVAAISAGNAAIIKPSEVASHSAAVMTELISRYLDTSCFGVINGGVAETTKLLELQFDHIFYTGNGMVAKIVMAAAAKHLTPVVLELGGKSPCIIDDTVDVKTVAKRIMWAKSINCGQTCIAPDYALVTPSVLPSFVSACSDAVKELYGPNIKSAPTYPRIITERHFDRLAKLIDEQLKVPGAKVAVGGFRNRSELFLEPTVITGVGKDAKKNPLMEDELFGPVLPVIEVQNVDEAVEYVRTRDKPLALYVFSKSDKTISNVLSRTDSGNTMANDLLMNMTIGELPFGGVGPSGMGKYHGHHGFLAYTHPRSTMIRPHGLEKLMEIRYPPQAYTPQGRKLLAMIMERRPRGPFMEAVVRTLKRLPWSLVWWLACIGLGVLIGWFARERRA